MALSAVLEVSLFADSFRNLDLVHQGLYRVTITVRSDNSQAVPSNICTKSEVTTGERLSTIETHLVFPSKIRDNAIQTRTFFIKYCDEEVKLGEMLVFRLEVPIEQFR
jgi:hypothetical protein